MEPDLAEVGELVIGLVGPIGSDLERTLRLIRAQLEACGFCSVTHRLSSFFDIESPTGLRPRDASNEYERIKCAMDCGDSLRRDTQDNEIMALVAANLIGALRPKHGGATTPLERTAHLLRSLKRPEEVHRLRNIYGSRFLLISVYSPESDRVRHLQERHSMAKPEATELVVRDGAGGKYGQATTKTFELADLFLDASATQDVLTKHLQRFFHLVFGSPLVTPTKHEHGMFSAFAASLRSGDLSRQVGAVIMTEGGTVVAQGNNDAPRFGGEPYWPEDGDDERDLPRGYDSNEQRKRTMVENILREFGALEDGVDPLETARRRLGDSGVLDITEYGRAVHAEMAVLMNCARLGIPTAGRILYCTTFPCHNCAKHIVAAGIKRVYFIEPYPKSRAQQLHDDAVALSPIEERVTLLPFVGIGPRRYVELFALRDAFGARVERKNDTGDSVEWREQQASVVLPDRLMNYLEMERRAAEQLKQALRR